MPDATITSTASTFGTISGTFSSDQSTVTGTISGVVTGTLTGSVGVPGPAGPAGEGVPTGGTTGQVLAKVDGVDYNTEWVNASGGTWGTITGTLSNQTDLQTALNLKAPLASPALTGVPTAPTAATLTSTTQLATTAFVQQELAAGTAVAKNLEVYVRNQSGSTIPAGSIVYISGATGNRPLITLAQANNDANSAQTIGFVKASIANNGFGYVMVRGELENIDTSALTEGVQLYLSPTTAGAWTTTKPSAPQHLVYVGIVIRSHPTLGVILVAVQNGYELNELHDVAISSPTNGQVLKYDSATSLWKNATDSSGVAWGGITGTLSSQTDLQSALDGKYSTSNPSGYITSSALSGYATESWVTAGFYPLTGNPSGFITSSALTGYATESWVTSQLGSYLTTYAPLASPALTGTPTAPTAAVDTNTTQVATTAYVVGQGYLKSATASSTYAPLASPALTGTPTAPTATAGTSTTQLATTAFVTTADNLKANLASPTFTGTPAAPTAAADTNTTQLATTAFVVGQAGSATPLVNGTAAVGTSLRYARQDHVHGTDTTRAPLASPTFTGTPAAPTATAGTSTTQIATTAFVTTADNLKANLASPALTGTPTAPTATAGTNTTQIATTAFVTAAVPAAATHTQAVQFASSTTYTKVIDASSQVIAPSVLRVWPSPSNYNGTSTSGAGASAALYLTGYVLTSPSAGVAGNARAYHGNVAGDLDYMMWGGTGSSLINFSRRVSMSFRFAQFPSSQYSVTRVLLGKIHGTAVGDLTTRGIGVKYVPTASTFDFYLQVHNGTTLTNVLSSTQYAGGVADLEVVSDGSGNVTLYLNGASVATSSAGPTGTTSNSATVFAEIESTASTTNQPKASIGRLFVNSLNF